MPRRILPMNNREVLRRLKAGESIRAIKRELSISRQNIRKIRDWAQMNGWWDRVELPTEYEILGVSCQEKRPHRLDPIQEKLKVWHEAGYSHVVMSRMASKILDTALNEITVRRYVKHKFPKRPKAIVRREFDPGAVAEVDFGDLGLMSVEGESRPRKVYLFSLRLCHSRTAYRQLVLSQKMETFFDCHVNAFEFFGGVPLKVVCDNLKAAIIKAAIYDPMVNKAYQMLAEHYGFLISPCQPGRPEHKGGVEHDVGYVKGNFMPEFREEQKLKGRSLPSFEEGRKALRQWETEIDLKHRIKYVDRTPEELFVEEKPFLQALPLDRWDPVHWKTAKVGVDWCVQADKAFYSVPNEYIGKETEVCINSRFVAVYHDWKLIARHAKAVRHWQRMRLPEHEPPNYKKYLEMTSEGTRRWARMLGENVFKIVEHLLGRKGIDGLPSSRGVCGLEKKYGRERLDKACARAIKYRIMTYNSIKNILVRELDCDGSQIPKDSEIQVKFKFDRTDEYLRFQ
jgi:transposase